MENLIWKEVQGKKFKVIKEYKDKMKDNLANFGRSKSKYSTFGAFYELYLYALAIGIHLDKRVKLEGHSTETFNMVSEWTGNKIKILNTFFMVLISLDEIRKEAEFDFITLELDDLDQNELKKRVNNIVRIIEEYANGGFEFINNKYKEEPAEFEHCLSLQHLFEEVIKESVLK